MGGWGGFVVGEGVDVEGQVEGVGEVGGLEGREAVVEVVKGEQVGLWLGELLDVAKRAGAEGTKLDALCDAVVDVGIWAGVGGVAETEVRRSPWCALKVTGAECSAVAGGVWGRRWRRIAVCAETPVVVVAVELWLLRRRAQPDALVRVVHGARRRSVRVNGCVHGVKVER